MRVTIWDLDYYYAKDKTNCQNPDVMRISSYHKQLGDIVNFVRNEYDIRRPYDLYYIIKEKQKTPNPPMDFYTNSKVRWWGDANRVRINWKMDRVMLGCRPDYLLYPEKNTRTERAEYIRLYDNQAKLIPISQDYSNTFKFKNVIVADKYMWESSKNDLYKGLDMLKAIKNVSFLEPFRLDLILRDKILINKIMQLNLTSNSKISFSNITFELIDAAIEFVAALRSKFPGVSFGGITITYNYIEHWDNHDAALKDYENIKSAIVKGRKNGVYIIAASLKHRLDTPYYHLFEELNKWSSQCNQSSWFEYLCRVHHFCNINVPATWDDGFRDLIRQTYIDHEFFLIRWKNNMVSENEVPWQLLDKEFQFGI